MNLIKFRAGCQLWLTLVSVLKARTRIAWISLGLFAMDRFFQDCRGLYVWIGASQLELCESWAIFYCA